MKKTSQHSIHFPSLSLSRRSFLTKSSLGLAGILVAQKAPAIIIKSMLGADGTKYVSSAHLYTAADYVQDGLIAMWDGIENAGWGVHDANATVWKDLLGSNDFSQFMEGVAFEENCINLPASRAAAIAPLAYATTDILSIEGVVSLGGWNGLVLVSFTSGTPITRWLGFRSNGTVNFGNGQMCALGDLKRNVISTFSVSYSNGVSIYKDSKSLANAGTGMTWTAISGSGTRLNSVATSYSKSKIYCIRLYSRALTADEIAANYVVDKARFNIS